VPVPWKAKSPVDLRKEMMARLARGERMADLCRDYGISRKTGQKFKARFERLGAAGLEDRSRAPRVIPHKTPPELMELVVEERRQHPSWGSRKLKDVLERRLGRPMPSHAAIERALREVGLVKRRKRRPNHRPEPTGLRAVSAPNEVWAMDYKGQFRLGDRSHCFPLTITDQHSRFILACEGMPAISDEDAREICEEVFRAWGLPAAIRSDNGAPFASSGIGGLTKLSAYFLRLGIELERIRPASPQENGRHERMHRTLKAETTRPARANLLQQQERFDEWVHEFNHERPHEALEMKRPAEVFTSSTKAFPDPLPELDYPTHDDVLQVSRHGFINIATIGSVRVSSALAEQHVGIREEDDGTFLVTYANIDLGLACAPGALTPIPAILSESL
jgi:transposase InsO family protein